MKLAWLKNRRGRRGAPRLSLFPFLAVLICTMGALVLLFLAVTRQARLQAAREAAAKFSERQDDIKAQREAAQWRVEQLRTTRQATQSQLSNVRLTLGHFEEHSQRLRARLAELQAAVKKLGDTEVAAATQQSSGTQEELRTLQAKIAEAERQLNVARQAAQNRPKSYAVVPYDGPNQTRRRPIYLECLPDAIILQPEGIRFTDSDFPEIGPGEFDEGNPLAVGMRAAEQFLAQSGLDAKHGGQPYPLLLVRPSGGVAYGVALKALKSWGSEMGYQLVDEDWKLAYPPSDPRLAEVVQRALVTARARLPEVARLGQLRAAAAARAKQGSYRVSPTGGIVRVSDRGDDADFRPAEPSGRYGQRRGAGGYGGAGREGEDEQRAGSNSGGTTLGEAPAPRLPYAAALEAGAEPAPGAVGRGSPYGAGTGVAGVPGTGGIQGPAAGGSGAAAGLAAAPGTPANAVSNASVGRVSQPVPQSPDGLGNPSYNSGGGNPQGQSRQAGPRIERPEGYVSGRPYEPKPDPRPAPENAEGMASTPLRPGEWHPSEEYASPPKRDNNRDDKRNRKDVKSLAEKRGRDWGLRDAASGSVPNTRPIRVECCPDRLVIVPDDPRGSPKVIPLADRTEVSIDKFMAAVWEHMDSWGIAGRGMYWRPILSVRVAPGAEQRFEEFNTLLEGSGLTVRRRQ